MLPFLPWGPVGPESSLALMELQPTLTSLPARVGAPDVTFAMATFKHAGYNYSQTY